MHLGAQIGYNDLQILNLQIQEFVHTQSSNMRIDAQDGYNHLHILKIKTQLFVHT